MTRGIQAHATRLSAAHEAALDAAFHVGQRVVTPEGLTGRVLLVTESFSPGNTEYQVVLDSGMGGGTYLASQLRPVPDDVRALPQFSNLPAGVTGRYLTEDEARQRWRSSPEAQAGLTADEAMARVYAAQDEAFHTANLDYPEMGTILRDRPDPAGQVTMIGALQKTAHYIPWDNSDDLSDEEYADQEEHNDTFCHVCQEHHDSAEEAQNHGSAHTDWDSVYPHLGSEVHRGMAVDLPRHVHDIVHDRTLPAEHRAQVLNEHLATRPLGTSWAPEESRAEHYAVVSDRDGGQTHVILHAGLPAKHHIETDPDELEGRQVLGFEEHEDHEIPLKYGAPLSVHRVSWRQSNRMSEPQRGWEHHSFGQPMPHIATSEMGDQIDDHGDAPEHGLIPRAEDPNAYDQQSTEGQPDPTWDQDPYHQQAKNGVSPSSGNEGPDGTGGPPDGMGPGDGGIPAMASLRDETGDRWHEFRNRYQPDTIHRGIHVQLPGHVHKIVHDERLPREERARALANHFAGASLGMHWTPHVDIAHRSIQNASAGTDHEEGAWNEGDEYDDDPWAQQWESPETKTDVIFHARRPGERNRIRNPDTLQEHGIGWQYSPDEHEMPLRPGSPVRLSGISWKKHEPEYPMEPYEHHDFERPMRHEARVPWTDHQRTLLHSWQVVPTVTEGDFVPSYNFTNKHPVAGPVFEPEPEPGEEPMEVTGALEGYPEYEDPRELHQHLDYHHGADPESGGWHESAEDMQRYHRRLHEHPEHHPVFEHHHDPGAYRQSGISYEHFHPDEAQHPDRFAGGAQDAETHWVPVPGDVATPEQHADPRQRTRVLHTLSSRQLSFLDPRTAQSRKIADSVYGQLAKDYPHQAISWVHDVPWEGPGTTALHDIDWKDRQQWAAYNQPERVARVGKKAEKKIANGDDPKPAILMRPVGDRQSRIGDGHHRALSALLGDRALHSYTAQVPDADGPWDTMHDQQFTQAQGGSGNAAERGPDGSPEDREQLHRDVEGRVATLPRPEAGEDDGLDDSLDFASEGDSPQDDEDEAGQDGTPAAPGQDVPPGQPGMPPVTHGPPLTQGSADGRRERQKGMILQTPQDMQEEAEKKAQLEELGNEDGGDGGPPSKKEKKAALRLFREAARSPSFGFEFTASWRDVVAKAKRLRTAGRVRITAVAAGYVIGEVGGDHDVYESSVQRRPGHPNSILAFACGCPWASFHQDKSYPGRLNGRPCSHAYAVHLESLSRRMNGRPMTADPELPAWLTQQVVVKSLPPWGQGGWAQTWTAPATTQPFYASLRQPELTPAHQAARLLLDGGTSPAAVGTLMTLAGMASSDRLMARHLETAHGWPADYLDGLREGDKPLEHFHDRSHAGGSANKIPHRHDQDPGSSGPLRLVEADQANAPWGSDNTAPHSPVKPYGATEPPQKDMDPGSYGFLAGPDPENWGEIRDDSAVQMPLGNEAMLRESGIDELYPPATEHHMDEWNVPEPDQMGGWDENDEGRSGRRYETPDELHEHTDHFVPGDLERHHLSLRHEADAQRSLLVPTAPSPLPPDLNYPDVSDFHERQESFPYADQANAGGPSTSITPRDPDGIRMEEALQRAIVAASRPDWHIPGDPGAKPVVLDSIKGHESSDEPHHPHDCTCTDCDYHRYHSQHARPVWAAAEHQAAVPDWVRSQRRDRELCERCGNPATSQWAGTGEKMCDDCVDKRRAEYFSEDRWRHQATASPSDAEAPQLSGGLGAELKDEPDAALDPQGLTGGDTPVGGGDAGTGSEAPSAMGTASMGEWGASRRAVIRSRLTGGYALDADTTGGGPGVSEHDEDGMGWDEPSIQTVGEAQWSGAGADSDEVAVPAGQPQGPAIDGGGLDTMASASEREIVAQFQASAAARQLGGHSGDPGAASDGGIAAAARHFLKTGKVLSDEEAGELIAEGRGTRARNLDLLDLEGTHYEAEDEAMNRRGLSLDNFDDDLVLI